MSKKNFEEETIKEFRKNKYNIGYFPLLEKEIFLHLNNLSNEELKKEKIYCYCFSSSLYSDSQVFNSFPHIASLLGIFLAVLAGIERTVVFIYLVLFYVPVLWWLLKFFPINAHKKQFINSLKLMYIDEILEERKQSALSDAEFKDKYGSIDLELPL